MNKKLFIIVIIYTILVLFSLFQCNIKYTVSEKVTQSYTNNQYKHEEIDYNNKDNLVYLPDFYDHQEYVDYTYKDIYPEISNIKDIKNVLKNGNFAAGNYSKAQIVNKVEGWNVSPYVILNNGKNYNWSCSKTVIEIESNLNASISQTFTLGSDTNCTVELDYLSTQFSKNSSMKIEFNSILIFNNFSFDKKLHRYRRELYCMKGDNTITITNTGGPNDSSMTLDNIKLYVPNEINVGRLNTDIALNGSFQLPFVTLEYIKLFSIPYWEVNQFSFIGWGRRFNNNWRSGQVARLPNTKDNYLRQSFSLNNDDKCLIQFEYATMNLNRPGTLLVSLNTQVILKASFNSLDIQFFSKVADCLKGKNTISFHNDINNNYYSDITIDNVKIFVDKNVADYNRYYSYYPVNINEDIKENILCPK